MALLRIATPHPASESRKNPHSRPAVRGYLPAVVAAVVGAALSIAAYVAMGNVEQENEALAISRRANSNVASIHGLEKLGGNSFLVLEFVEGLT